MAQEKKTGSNNQETVTLPEAKIILAFLACRLDDLEKQLVASRKKTEDALKAREALTDVLAFYLKDQGAITEYYRQDIAVMMVKLGNREAELRALRAQHSAFVEQICERIVRAQAVLAQSELEDRELLRRQPDRQFPAGTPEGPRPSETPSEEPDFGGLLIDLRSVYDADLPPTVVQEDWIAGSPPRPDPMETAVEEQLLDGLPGPGGLSASGTSDVNITNRTSGQVASDPSGTNPPSQDINWRDYTGLGFNSNLGRAAEHDNDSEVPTEPFTPEETEHIYRRYYPHLLNQVGGNAAAGEAQGNKVGKASPSDDHSKTAGNIDDGKGDGEAVDQGEGSGNTSGGSRSGDVKGKGKTVDRSTPTAGTTAGEASRSRGRGGIAHPTPTVLRTGLHLPGHLGGEAPSHNAQEAHSLPIQTCDHSARHGRAPPTFFEFSVHFNPPLGSWHHFRHTVHIGNLPAGITLQALMESVRGGTVLRASLLDTVPVTGSPSALVTFVEPQAAADYAAFAGLYPIRFSSSVATVTLIATPNFPMPYHLNRAVRSYNQTRVLRLDGIQLSPTTMGSLLDDLDVGWASRLGLVESIRRLNDLAVDLTFASVDLALRAYSAFLTNEVFQYLDTRGTFLPDPCAEPLETLIRRQAEMYGGLQDAPEEEEDLYDPDAPEDPYDDTKISD